jgi:hypothetical protein
MEASASRLGQITNMNNIRSRMINDNNLRVAYGAASRAQAFRSAAQLADRLNQPLMSTSLRGMMRLWSRLAAEEIKANVR